MRSPVYALSWEIARSHRWAFWGVAGLLVICATGYRLVSESLQQSELAQLLSYLPFAFSLILVFACCHFTERSPRTGLAGFPHRLFVLPVPSWVLVSCPMAFGVAVMLITFAAWAILVYWPLGINMDLGLPMLALAATVVGCQATIWTLAGMRLTRLIVLGLLGTVLVTAVILVYMPDFANIFVWPTHYLTAVLFFSLILMGYAGSLSSVDWQRHGGRLAWPSLRPLLLAVMNHLPRRRSPFRSQAGAQLWYEWRRNGFVLPFCVAAVMLVVVGPVLKQSGHVPEVVATTAAWIVLLPLLLAGLIGVGYARIDFWTRDLGLPVFLAVRPLSSGAWVAAKLQAAALASVMSWAIVLVLTPIYLGWWCDLTVLHRVWEVFLEAYPVPVRLPLMLLLGAGLVLLTWRLLVAHLCAGLSGRITPFAITAGFTLLGYLAAGAWAIWLRNSHQQKAVWDLIPWIPWPFVVWVIELLLIVKVGLSARAWQRSYRQGLISSSAVWSYGLTWLGGTGALIALAVFLLRDIGWLARVTAFAMLLALPLARIGAAPLALAWNRHR